MNRKRNEEHLQLRRLQPQQNPKRILKTKLQHCARRQRKEYVAQKQQESLGQNKEWHCSWTKTEKQLVIEDESAEWYGPETRSSYYSHGPRTHRLSRQVKYYINQAKVNRQHPSDKHRLYVSRLRKGNVEDYLGSIEPEKHKIVCMKIEGENLSFLLHKYDPACSTTLIDSWGHPVKDPEEMKRLGASPKANPS
ncbi:hypothetical protein EVAR_85865_1 [Eumeta japonica]|uniref:Uncharacterized protein n=1 Tax=Eumeta variegata TaxID=151549 RepID=A0A4C2A794_EUMVA|nr:hypothetical protein EVAR_85865_1 [Eumeta japonica]